MKQKGFETSSNAFTPVAAALEPPRVAASTVSYLR